MLKQFLFLFLLFSLFFAASYQTSTDVSLKRLETAYHTDRLTTDVSLNEFFHLQVPNNLLVWNPEGTGNLVGDNGIVCAGRGSLRLRSTYTFANSHFHADASHDNTDKSHPPTGTSSRGFGSFVDSENFDFIIENVADPSVCNDPANDCGGNRYCGYTSCIAYNWDVIEHYLLFEREPVLYHYGEYFTCIGDDCRIEGEIPPEEGGADVSLVCKGGVRLIEDNQEISDIPILSNSIGRSIVLEEGRHAYTADYYNNDCMFLIYALFGDGSRRKPEPDDTAFEMISVYSRPEGNDIPSLMDITLQNILVLPTGSDALQACLHCASPRGCGVTADFGGTSTAQVQVRLENKNGVPISIRGLTSSDSNYQIQSYSVNPDPITDASILTINLAIVGPNPSENFDITVDYNFADDVNCGADCIDCVQDPDCPVVIHIHATNLPIVPMSCEIIGSEFVQSGSSSSYQVSCYRGGALASCPERFLVDNEDDSLGTLSNAHSENGRSAFDYNAYPNAQGRDTITYTSFNEEGRLLAQCSLDISVGNWRGCRIDPQNFWVNPGGREEFTLTCWNLGQIVPCSQDYSLSLSPSSAGEVGKSQQADFYLQASSIYYGDVRITADFGDYSCSTDGTISPLPPDRCELDPSSITMNPGDSQSFYLSCYEDNQPVVCEGENGETPEWSLDGLVGELLDTMFANVKTLNLESFERSPGYVVVNVPGKYTCRSEIFFSLPIMEMCMVRGEGNGDFDEIEIGKDYSARVDCYRQVGPIQIPVDCGSVDWNLEGLEGNIEPTGSSCRFRITQGVSGSLTVTTERGVSCSAGLGVAIPPQCVVRISSERGTPFVYRGDSAQAIVECWDEDAGEWGEEYCRNPTWSAEPPDAVVFEEEEGTETEFTALKIPSEDATSGKVRIIAEVGEENNRAECYDDIDIIKLDCYYFV